MSKKPEVASTIIVVSPMAERWLEIPEYIREAKMSRTTFFEELAEGKIKTVKRGRRTLIPGTEFLRRMRSLESA